MCFGWVAHRGRRLAREVSTTLSRPHSSRPSNNTCSCLVRVTSAWDSVLLASISHLALTTSFVASDVSVAFGAALQAYLFN